MSEKTYRLWELFKPNSRHYILLDGDWVVNGHYYVECDPQHDRMRIKNYHDEDEWIKAFYLNKVPIGNGDYNDIINAYDEARENERE